MSFRFEAGGSFYGNDMDDLGPIEEAQVLAAAKDGDGNDYESMRAWREHSAAQLREGTDLQGFEIWHAYEDDATAPRFRLIYFPASDSGTLFHSGGAELANLALWPDGFRPKHGEPAADPAALSAAYRAARS